MNTTNIRSIAVIVLAAVFITVFPAAASAGQGYSDTAYTDGIAILRGLGLWDDVFDTMQPNDLISKKMFAVLVKTVYGDQNSYETSRFTDAPAEEPYRSAVNFMAARQLFDAGDGLCEPERPMTMRAAARAAVTMLGRQPIAEKRGGEPAGYLAAAQNCGLTAGFTAGTEEGLSWACAVILIVNTIHTPVMARNPAVGEPYSLEEADLFISEQLHIYTGGGILEEAGGASLLRVGEPGSGGVTIDGGRLQAPDSARYQDLLGFQVEFWYRDLKNGVRELQYIRPNRKQNSVMTLDAEEIQSADGTKIEYFDDTGRRKSFRTDFNAYIIYNGRLLEKPGDVQWLPECGTLTAIDHDGDSSYDVLCVVAYESAYLVETVSAQNQAVIDVFGRKLSFLPEGGCREIRVMKQGAEAAFSEIGAGDVVTAAYSADRSFMTAYISQNSISAAVSEIRDGRYKIGAEWRKASEDYAQYLGAAYAPRLKAGDGGTFYIDEGGRIAAAFLSKDGMQYGYVIAKGAPEPLSETYPVKLLTERDGVREYLIPGNVSLNYARNSRALSAVLESEDFVGSVIRYKEGGDGEIKAMLTANATEDFTCDKRDAAMSYRNGGRCFDGHYSMGLNTRVMYVSDSPGEGDDGYYVSSKINVGDLSYSVDIYDTDEWNIMGLAVLDITKYEGKVMNASSRPAMVKELATILKSDGTPTYSMTVLFQGKEFTYTLQSKEVADNAVFYSSSAADGGRKGVVAGDIIRFRCHDKTGEVVSIERRYGFQEKALWCGANVSNVEYNGTHRYVTGKLKSIREGIAVLEFPDGTTENYYVMGKSFGCYDAGRKEPVNVADISTLYECVDQSRWNVVVYMHYSVASDVFMYQMEGA